MVYHRICSFFVTVKLVNSSTRILIKLSHLSCIKLRLLVYVFPNLYNYHAFSWDSLWSSSRPEVFYKKGFIKNFDKFPGKHLFCGFLLNIFAGLRLATLLKKRPQHWCFAVNFANFFRTPFFIEHLRWLHLSMEYYSEMIFSKIIMSRKKFEKSYKKQYLMVFRMKHS